ncbi:MAG: organic hydroperoxide resistance protein [Acetobacteraceae bacterium]|nr:organic hydroperoxide resistance protein [Acetobacteraceae bacterium]MBV8573595.1 organic hydroperoxide resistance protein [Acetobacteraceae bacterium]
MNVLYTATATATGGREGKIRSSDGMLDMPLAMPKELGGSGRPATNPEQLFAAGYAACFENALRRVARERKTPITESTVEASVGIGRTEDNYFSLQVDLKVSVPGKDRAEVENLARIAHEEVCPYSRATRGNIDVRVSVV